MEDLTFRSKPSDASLSSEELDAQTRSLKTRLS
jgi:hypothetical protein